MTHADFALFFLTKSAVEFGGFCFAVYLTWLAANYLYKRF